jgi:iron(III) transport system ATP-binding protein
VPEIHVQSLVKEFGDQRALDDVSFTVADGELFTLLGPSGCGKSTTLMSIAGFQTPEQGRIAVGEETFFDAAKRVAIPAERRNLGIVFQSYAVWPHMTVFDNLAFPLKVRKLKREAIRTRVREVLELVEMTPLERRYPHQLSGGQQQRVALARALVYSPSVLLLDEPFSNLDAKLRERARAWVKELQHRLGLTTIFVTHDQDEALSMSDRVAVMSAGEVQQIGTPEEIYRRPANRFVAEFVGRVNLIPGTVSSSGDGSVVVDVTGSPHKLTVLNADGASGEVTVAVRPEAVSVLHAGDTSSNGTNTWEASVGTVAFLGDHYEYEVTAGALALTVQSSRRVEGDRIKVHIPPDACSVVA